MQNKIAVAIPYFGRLPVYFNIFLKGCEYNTDFLDVHFFTDIEIKEKLPLNFIVHPISFNELKLLVRKKLGYEVNLGFAYKLCDFKPAYGKIFEDYLQEYTFWGFGDIDLIYSNLSKFITPSVLNKNDIIIFRDDFVSGAFALFRNTEYLKNLFAESEDCIRIYTTPKYCHFDECGNKYGFLNDRIPIDEIPITDITCFTTLVLKSEKEGKSRVFMRPYAKEAMAFEDILVYDNGKISLPGWGMLGLYHMVYDKTQPYYKVPDWKTVPDRFYITPTGFYKEADLKFKLYIIKKNYRKISGVFKYFKNRAMLSFNHRVLGKKRK